LARQKISKRSNKPIIKKPKKFHKDKGEGSNFGSKDKGLVRDGGSKSKRSRKVPKKKKFRKK